MSDDSATTPFQPPLTATVPAVPGQDALLPQGTRLVGRYILEGVLGQGGMGVVYLGRDEVLARQVAVKMIRPADSQLLERTVQDAAMREAFIREARLGAQLTHAALAAVFDFGFHDGHPFAVFEYVSGETLREVLAKRGRLPLDDAQLILASLAQALDFAHTEQVVHRDLKPDNIRATATGQFKILDLGLARAFRDEKDWRFAGTPAYASPEQAGGLPCDGRTDQYALALIAFEMLTGRRPFTAATLPEMLAKHRLAPPPDPRSLRADLPGTVAEAILRALSKDPNARFASCEGFALALGCPLLSAPAPEPQAIHVTRLRAIWGWRNTAQNHLFGEDLPHLAFTDGFLWAVFRGELVRWPLAIIDRVENGWWGRTLIVHLREKARPRKLVFDFFDRKQGRAWREQLGGLLPAEGASADLPPVEPVVMLEGQPPVRYQALGTVANEADRAETARAGLIFQAALLGADAVVGVKCNRVSQPGKTVHRSSGIAVRGADAAGRTELRWRWIEGEIRSLADWMTRLVVILALMHLVPLLILYPLEYLREGHEILFRLASDLGALSVLYGLPLGMIALLRILRWPQLALPTAMFVVALGGGFAAWIVGYCLSGLTVRPLPWNAFPESYAWVYVLSSPLAVMVLLLGRRAWRLGPDATRLLSGVDVAIERRRLCAACWVIAVVFAFGLVSRAAYCGWQQIDLLPGHSRPQWHSSK